LDNAFQAVKGGMSVNGAAKQLLVPLTTFRDRVDGRISIDCVSSGPSPLFTQEQESNMVAHVKTMSEIGYGYTWQKCLNLPVLPGATEAWFELQLQIADPQIMEIFLVTFLIHNQCVL
jgi:hypothetical protein